MFRFKCNVFLVLLFFLNFSVVIVRAQISDKRLCVDAECKEPISIGKTQIRYNSNHEKILSFLPGVDVTIYSKSAGSRPDLWGVEINGARGYAPLKFIRETKIFKIPTVFVDTEATNISSRIEVPSVESKTKPNETPKPDPVKQNYEIIDGTKIPFENEKSKVENENIVVHNEEKPKENVDSSVLGSIVSSISNFIAEADEKNKKLLEDMPDDEDEETDDDSEDDEDLDEEDEQEDLNKNDDQENHTSHTKDNRDTPKLEETHNIVIGESFRSLLQVNEQENSEENVVKEVKSPLANPVKTDNLDITGKAKETPTEKSETENTPTKPVVQSKADDNLDAQIKSLPPKSETPEGATVTPLPLFGDLNHDYIDIGHSEAVTTPSPILSNRDVTNEKSDQISTLSVALSGVDTVNETTEGKTTPSATLSDTSSTSSSTHNMAAESSVPTHDTKTTPSPNVVNESGKNEEIRTSSATKTGEEKIDNSYGAEDASSSPNSSGTNTKTLFSNTVDEGGKLEEISTLTHPLSDVDVKAGDSSNNVEITIPSASSNNTDIKTSSSSIGNESGKSEETLTSSTPKLFSNTVDESGKHEEISALSHTEDNKDQTFTKDSINNIQAFQEKSENSVENSLENDLKTEPQNFEIKLPENFEIKSDKSTDKDSLDTDVEMTDSSDFEIKHENFEIKSETTENDGTIQKDALNVPEGQIKTENFETETIERDYTERTLNDLYKTLEEKSKKKVSDGLDRNKNEAIEELHEHREAEGLISKTLKDNQFCMADENSADCSLVRKQQATEEMSPLFDFIETIFASNDVILVLLVTSGSVIVFLWGYFYIGKSRRIRPLIAKINQLEKSLLLAEEENKILNEKLLQVQNEIYDQVDSVSSEAVEILKQELELAHNSRASLEEQIVNLEKELENSTEVGLELNRMLSDFLSSQNSDALVANIEQLQRQLVEQQSTINSYTETLNVKETEIHELRLELDISNSKVTDLQRENNKLTAALLKLEEEKDELQNKLETEINVLKKHIEQLSLSSTAQINKVTDELKVTQAKLEDAQRLIEIKIKEYNLLKDNVERLKNLKGDDLKSLLDVSATKAELEQLKKEKQSLLEHCERIEDLKNSFEKQYENMLGEVQVLRNKFDESDKEKLETQTKLKVLENYFKGREEQLQKELAKHESLFMEKEGQAYSINEKIKYMQEELQNYKAQNDSLKQEIMEQEVQMKSQISLLEKRVHENWVAARQAERKLEEAKQEAAQLRNRLTLRERSFNEEKLQNRLKSPSEQNGELPVSPSPASPPLLFGSRDLTTSPPLPGLPPFLPPPPGVPVPFMPPPIPGGVPHPFMPPPPSMFPGDRRPAPLGRMSSPPLNSRYSPDSRAYSPYSRNSPSPTSDDDYRHSPPPLHRGFSPLNDRGSRREYRRSPDIVKMKASRNNKGSMHSSGSANSNESLDKVNRKSSKV